VPEGGRANYEIEIGDELSPSPEPTALFPEDLTGFKIDPQHCHAPKEVQELTLVVLG